VLVGIATSDDAGVYQLKDDLAIVQTVDFFTPIVDDPFDFGRIAAANSLSDIYAMGATPVSALNIAAFPSDSLDLRILARILEGGAAVARQANVAIVGGHTIKDPEPKYGMAVVGVVDPRRMVTNAGARVGDALLLTKPLGTGILATALKRNGIAAHQMAQAVGWMVQLNEKACEAMLQHRARAATDVTGFGLLGHALEIARASNVGLVIEAGAVPLMDGVLGLIEQGFIPSGTSDNARTQAEYVSFASTVPEALRIALSDAQTSGGLLIAIAAEGASALRQAIEKAGGLAAQIGSVTSGDGIEVI
jgi:selenide,water dikinase